MESINQLTQESTSQQVQKYGKQQALDSGIFWKETLTSYMSDEGTNRTTLQAELCLQNLYTETPTPYVRS